MSFAPDITTNGLSLIIGPRAESQTMTELIATLALRGPVRVLDGGNCFDAYRIARQVRLGTTQMDRVMGQIQVARAFTCYQVLTLFEQTSADPAPQLVLDLLATFYDENVTLGESHRLLNVVIGHLRRLRRQAPVAVSIRPPRYDERATLVEALKEVADNVLIREEPLLSQPDRLF